MSFDPWSLFFGLIFSSIGFVYFRYGKKQQKFMTLLAGVLLMAYPYFISKIWIMIVIGVVLSIAPLLIQI